MWIRHNGEVIEVVEVEANKTAREMKVYRKDDPDKEIFTVTEYAVADPPELEVQSDSSDPSEDPSEDPPRRKDPSEDPEDSAKQKRQDYAIFGTFGLIVLLALLN